MGDQRPKPFLLIHHSLYHDLNLFSSSQRAKITINMIGATRRWFQRNRKGLAIGAGVIGAGYLAGQYVLSKISEARERMSSDRIAREKSVNPPLFSIYSISSATKAHERMPC